MISLIKSVNEKRKRMTLDFLTGKKILGISSEEITSIARRRKRLVMVNSGEMDSLNRRAEEGFRKRLKETSEDHYKNYLELKKGINVEANNQRISEVLNEEKFKKDFIFAIIELNLKEDETYISEAISQILDRKQKGLEKSLEGISRSSPKGKQFVHFISNLEFLANQTIHKQSLKESFLNSALRGAPINLYYYFCLRFKNEEGKLSISSDLEEFKFVDRDKKIQTKNGEAKKYQIGVIEDLTKLTEGLNINHNILVADFDLIKFGSKGDSLIPLSKEYIRTIRKTVNPRIYVEGNSSFFEKEINPEEYEGIFDSIYTNDGRFIKKEELERAFKSNFREYSISLQNWGEDSNRLYVAHSFARNILEGKALSKKGGNNIVVIFNRRIKLWESFNLFPSKPVPVVALPIYWDNKGGINLA